MPRLAAAYPDGTPTRRKLPPQGLPRSGFRCAGGAIFSLAPGCYRGAGCSGGVCGYDVCSPEGISAPTLTQPPPTHRRDPLRGTVDGVCQPWVGSAPRYQPTANENIAPPAHPMSSGQKCPTPRSFPPAIVKTIRVDSGSGDLCFSPPSSHLPSSYVKELRRRTRVECVPSSITPQWNERPARSSSVGRASTCQPPQPWNGCLTAAKAIRMRTRQAAATPTTLIIKTISCATYLSQNLLNLRENPRPGWQIVKKS